MNHHVSEGHGPPTFFITLSCAEYHWEEIKRILRDRFLVASQDSPDLESNYIQLVNDYTLIIQEYFQERVKIWLETVGRKIFRIKHYWLRYEFAPSRGQIHAHMLVISDFRKVFDIAHTLNGNKALKARFLSFWAEKCLGLTCNPCEEYDFNGEEDSHPAKSNLEDISNYEEDISYCLQCLQQHKCSSYCLRKRKCQSTEEESPSKKQRVCRSGAGIEKTPGKGDTDGFRLREDPCIVRDARGFDRLEMQRTNRRTVQSSTFLLQGKYPNMNMADPFLYRMTSS